MAEKKRSTGRNANFQSDIDGMVEALRDENLKNSHERSKAATSYIREYIEYWASYGRPVAEEEIAVMFYLRDKLAENPEVVPDEGVIYKETVKLLKNDDERRIIRGFIKRYGCEQPSDEDDDVSPPTLRIRGAGKYSGEGGGKDEGAEELDHEEGGPEQHEKAKKHDWPKARRVKIKENPDGKASLVYDSPTIVGEQDYWLDLENISNTNEDVTELSKELERRASDKINKIRKVEGENGVFIIDGSEIEKYHLIYLQYKSGEKDILLVDGDDKSIMKKMLKRLGDSIDEKNTWCKPLKTFAELKTFRLPLHEFKGYDEEWTKICEFMGIVHDEYENKKVWGEDIGMDSDWNLECDPKYKDEIIGKFKEITGFKVRVQGDEEAAEETQ